MLIGIVYGSTTGNTQDVAFLIKEKLGDKAADPIEIDNCSVAAMTAYDALLVGSPTWNTGEETERSGTSWDNFLYDDMENIMLSGKPVGVFGCGDSVTYGENFAEAIEELHNCFEKQGAKMIGYTSSKGYQHTMSKTERDGVFVGLPLDQVNEPDLTDKRVSTWCEQVLNECGLD